MNNNNCQVYFDCGFSRLRAGAFTKANLCETFNVESNFFFDHSDSKNLWIFFYHLLNSLLQILSAHYHNI